MTARGTALTASSRRAGPVGVRARKTAAVASTTGPTPAITPPRNWGKAPARRPPTACESWKPSETNPWAAFHARQGAKISAATTAPSQGQRVRSSALSAGSKSAASNTDTARRPAEYFERRASPAATPTSSHARPRARSSSHVAAAKAASSGASGRASAPPSVSIGMVAASSAAARSACGRSDSARAAWAAKTTTSAPQSANGTRKPSSPGSQPPSHAR